MIFKWELKSQLEFYVDPMPNLSSAICLFLNPIRIQIRTEFMWVPIYYRYWAHVFSFLPIFSLSPPSASLLPRYWSIPSPPPLVGRQRCLLRKSLQGRSWNARAMNNLVEEIAGGGVGLDGAMKILPPWLHLRKLLHHRTCNLTLLLLHRYSPLRRSKAHLFSLHITGWRRRWWRRPISALEADPKTQYQKNTFQRRRFEVGGGHNDEAIVW